MTKLLLALLLVISPGCAHSKGQSKTVVTASQAPAEMPPELRQLLGIPEPTKTATVVCQATGICVPKYEIDGKIDEDMANGVIAWVDKAQAMGIKDVVITITSPGGAVDEGFRIIKKLENSPVRSHCVADIEVASMGAAILEGCTERLMTKRTSLMFHSPAVTAQLRGGETQFRNVAEDLRASTRALAEHCVRRMKVTAAEYIARTAGGTNWFMVWSEALEFGAVDAVVDTVKSVTDKLRQPQS